MWKASGAYTIRAIIPAPKLVVIYLQCNNLHHAAHASMTGRGQDSRKHCFVSQILVVLDIVPSKGTQLLQCWIVTC